MSVSLRIGIIGGGGWLGGAIAGSILDSGLVDPQNLCLSYRSRQPPRFPNSFWTTDSQELADRSDVILLSVRRDDWRRLDVDASGKLVISVMAGIRLAALSERHKTDRVVRALPNAAAEVAKSYTPWIGASSITEDDRAVVRAIFETCGCEDEVERESDIDYLTGLTGSGPAFPALLGAAMMRDAVARGLTAEVARAPSIRCWSARAICWSAATNLLTMLFKPFSTIAEQRRPPSKACAPRGSTLRWRKDYRRHSRNR